MNGLEFETSFKELIRKLDEWKREMGAADAVVIPDQVAEGSFEEVVGQANLIRALENRRAVHIYAAKRLEIDIISICHEMAYALPQNVWVHIHDWSVRRIQTKENTVRLVVIPKNRRSQWQPSSRFTDQVRMVQIQ